MKKFFGEYFQNKIMIDGEEFLHLAVLRCQIGEEILCFIGDENEYLCKIESITRKNATAVILSKNICLANPKIKITLFQGLPKKDKLEFITQKTTELGVSKIIPFESEFTVAKPNENKIDRLDKITKEACKQCGRSMPVIIENPVKFKEMLEMLGAYDIVLFANEKDKLSNAEIKSAKTIAIIIGSEGGFSDNEIEIIDKLNPTVVGLGSRILRTETASIVLCGLVSYLTKN